MPENKIDFYAVPINVDMTAIAFHHAQNTQILIDEINAIYEEFKPTINGIRDAKFAARLDDIVNTVQTRPTWSSKLAGLRKRVSSPSTPADKRKIAGQEIADTLFKYLRGKTIDGPGGVYDVAGFRFDPKRKLWSILGKASSGGAMEFVETKKKGMNLDAI